MSQNTKFNLVCYTSVHKFQRTSLWDGWLCLWCKNWPWIESHNSMQFASGVTDALLQLSWKAQFWIFCQILQETSISQCWELAFCNSVPCSKGQHLWHLTVKHELLLLCYVGWTCLLFCWPSNLSSERLCGNFCGVFIFSLGGRRPNNQFGKRSISESETHKYFLHL